MEHNGLFAGQNRKLETQGYLLFPGSTAGPGSQKHQTTPKRERLLFFALPRLPWEPLYTTRVRNRAPVLIPSLRRAVPPPRLMRSPLPRAPAARAGPAQTCATRGGELRRVEPDRPEPSRSRRGGSAPAPRYLRACPAAGAPGAGGAAGAARPRRGGGSGPRSGFRSALRAPVRTQGFGPHSAFRSALSVSVRTQGSRPRSLTAPARAAP